MIVTRGMSFKSMGNFTDTCTDLEAAVAAFRTKKETWVGWPTKEEAVKNLLLAIAGSKITPGSTAHLQYSQEDFNKFYKKRGQRAYCFETFQCLHCGSRDTTVLCKCSRCLSAWFCNTDCQRKAWPKHKNSCNKKAHVCSSTRSRTRRGLPSIFTYCKTRFASLPEIRHAMSVVVKRRGALQLSDGRDCLFCAVWNRRGAPSTC